jgi:hypothetical protein
MPSTFTSSLGLELQATGENQNTWGIRNSSNFTLIDQAVAGQLTLSVAGNTAVTLTAAQSAYHFQKYTGVLTGSITVFVPNVQANWVIWNATTGAFTLTVNIASGVGTVIPQGQVMTVTADGTNVFQTDSTIQSGSTTWTASGGTVDAITATYAPAITAALLIDGLILGFRATGANATSTPTFAPNGLTAHTITKRGGGALIIGDIPAANAEVLVRYNLANTRWELLNPAHSGDLVLLSAQTVSGGADIHFTSGIDSTFDEYEIHIHGLLIPGQAAHPFRDDGAPLFRSIAAQHSD